MPALSRFYGIVVTMYWREPRHTKRPHFHARYSGSEVSVAIEPLAILGGGLPARPLGLLIEWATLHKDELLENWKRVQSGDLMVPIAPLP